MPRSAATARIAEYRSARRMVVVTVPSAVAPRRWLTDMLPTPAREFPEFPAALAFLAVLAPAEVRGLLARRIEAQEERLTAIHEQAPPGMPRLFLIEDEYRAAMLTAELTWLREVVADLESGAFTWDLALIQKTLAQFS